MKGTAGSIKVHQEKAGFLHQLKLLLWKNVTLKKRSPLVFLFEISIPLVLFVVLLTIRGREHAQRIGVYHYKSIPLPSAGVLPILQNFCDGVPGDIYHTPNDRLKTFLSSVQHVLYVADRISRSVQIDTLQDLPGELGRLLSEGADTGADMATFTEQLIDYLSTNSTSLEDNVPNLDDLTPPVDSNFSMPGLDMEDITMDNLAQLLMFSRQFSDIPGIDMSLTQNSINPGDKYTAILELWNYVQPTLCGTNGTIPSTKIDINISRSDLYDRPLSNNQKSYIQMISRYLHSNPKILFAPNNAAATSIIKTVNATFETYANITTYARQWLNVSANIHDLIANATSQIPTSVLEELEKQLRPYFNTMTADNTASMHNLTAFFRNITRDVIGLVDKAAVTWLTLIGGVDFDVFRGFATEAELETYFLEQQYHDNVTVIAGLVFENLNSSTAAIPPHVRYKIRQNATLTPTTKLVRHQFWYPSPGTSDVKYYHFGFVWIQDLVERAIISLQTGRHVREPGAYFQRMPYPCWLGDQFVWLIQHVLPLCLMLSWVYSVAMLVQSIVYEKEKRLKEVMKMMGLSCGVHLCAWFITATVQMTITMATVAMMLHFGKVLPYSSPWIVFLFLELFAISSIGFSFLVSSLFSKARLAAACAGIFYFLTYVPYIYIAIKEDVTGDHIDGAIKTVASLFSTTALGLGGKYFLYYELEGVGAQWSNLAVSPREHDRFSLLLVLIMMAVDACAYFLLAWYIENVHPGKFGLPKPWYFPFTKSYWCDGYTETDTCSLKRLLGIRPDRLYQRMEDDSMGGCSDDGMFEPEPSGYRVGVEVSNLSMTYKGSRRPAVDNLTFNLYEDQITTFLGHNGAGKTTTMSILTGLFPATSGTATVYGRDIRNEMDSIRQSLGMCPQHNVLFDKLTVEEHLWFYARLKGLSTEHINQETERMLNDVGLVNKRRSLPASLSGGMQRKLSVAIAFVGGSRLVILDEPTAGVDPYSRRSIWNLLSKYKQGRTILLSTHHMDEAEILGDRIAVISDGKLRCCGSPFYLRNTLGEGYHLHILKADTEDSSALSGDHTQQFQSAKVLHKIQLFIQHAYILTDSQYELHVVLPLIQNNKRELIALLDMLQNEATDLDIKSFGVSDSSLEEIFFKLTDESLKKKHTDSVPSNDNDSVIYSGIEDSIPNTIPPQRDAPNNNDTELIDIYPSELHHSRKKDRCRRRDGNSARQKHTLERSCFSFMHFRALLAKRFKYTFRNRKSILTQIILPAAFVSIAMTVALSAPRDNDPPPLTLSPSQYFNLTQPRGNFIPYSYPSIKQNKSYSKDAGPRDLVATLRLPSGIGATCVLKTPYHSKYDAVAIGRLNYSVHNFQLVSNFFEKECGSVFLPGLKLEYYVPNVTVVHQTTTHASHGTGKATKLPYYPRCTCKSDGVGFQCADGGYRDPPATKVVTRDVLLDISGTDEQQYYLNTNDKYRLHRYGGFSFGTELPYTSISQIDQLAERYNDLMKQIVVSNTAQIWFNNQGYHAMPIYLNSLNNAILRANLPTSKGNPAAYGITVTNHPMKKTNNILNEDYITGGSDVLMAIFIIMAMSFVPASFVVFLVHERAIKAKHLQFVSGVNPVVYWVSNYVWDMCNYIIPATCIIGILLAFHIPAYVAKENFEAVIALFLLYGWSVTPMMYPASFLFHESSVAYIFLIVINLFTGITCVLTGFMLEMFDYDNHLKAVNDILKQAFLLFPNYCLGNGLMDIALNQYKNEYYSDTGQYDKIQSPMLWDLTGKKLVSMATVGVIFFVFTILCEYRFFVRCRLKYAERSDTKTTEDPDVVAERQRSVYGSGRQEMLRVNNLTKVYKTRKLGRVEAVNNLTLAIPAGECFGLLGVNGAGKTTTFKMLTGDVRPTAGDATLNSYSILRDIQSVQQNIGYCPQSDAIFDELTPKEHLQLYARLRGIPQSQQNKVVNWALRKLSLDRYADQTSGTLSGGNKRKLSTAISLMGDPPLIYMDEPTSGMDPYSRRFLWDTIRGLVAAGKSVLFTSHSMEECEALCTRLAIMANGQMKCLGSIQHLKDKYGSGYTIHVTMTSSPTTAQQHSRAVEDYMQEHICGCELKEIRTNVLIFETKKLTQNLVDVFRILETLTEMDSVQDYSVNQNDLDSVFVKLAQQHTSDEVARDDGDTQARENIGENVETNIDPYSRHSTDYDEPLILIERNSAASRQTDNSDEELLIPM